jgi:DNA-directed RNA polymerase specialized sigma54-like protein
LRCPFGCRQYHHKESSKHRSAKYYHSEKGRERKKALNEQRYRLTDNVSEEVSDEKSSEQQEVFAENKIGFIQEKGLFSYIQMVIGLIEGRYVSMEEVLKMLQQISRTHGIDRRRRFVYAFAYPRQRPP